LPDEFKNEFLKRHIFLYRAMFSLILCLICMTKAAGLYQSKGLLIFYVLIYLFLWGGEEFLYSGKDKEKRRYYLYSVLTAAALLAMTVASFFGRLPVFCAFGNLMIGILLITDDYILCNVYNTLIALIRRFIYSFLLSMAVFRPYWGTLKNTWKTLLLLDAFLVFLTVQLTASMIYMIITYHDKRYNKIYFKHLDVIEENKNLQTLQDKIEKVNSEINFQRLNLTRANSELERMNVEIRSLIDVMKFFSSGFSIREHAEYMLKNVTNVKKTSVSGLYLEKDAAMQDRPLIVIDPADSSLAPVLQRDIEQIYNLICEENIREPFVLIENFKPNSHYLQSDRVCNAIAFPSYDGDRFYGVMVCVATSYDFFLSGLSFYESAVMDFTSALISDRLYSQTEDMAKKDGLTKIFNRVYYNRFFPELCDQVMAGNSVMSLAMLDIDHFKSVNDTYGHLAGDEVIKMVAKVDEKYAEKYGGYAVRFGGEEFLLILPGVGLSDAKDILQQLHRDVRETVIHFEDKDISVNLSIGIACYKETCGNLQEIVDRADRAMYYSKEHGRGRITIDGKEGE